MKSKACCILVCVLLLLCVFSVACKHKEEPPATDPGAEPSADTAPVFPVPTPGGDGNPKLDGDTYRY